MRRKPKDDSRYSRDQTTEIYGVNPVLEMLRAAQRSIQEITVAEGARDARLSEIVQLARERNIPVHRSPRKTLDRITGNATHQGIVARVAAAQYEDADDHLELVAERVGKSSETCLDIL